MITQPVKKIIGILLVFILASFTMEEANYYVVIGAFSKETNARKYTGYARNIYLDAYYKFNPGRNLYYVYVMQTPRKDDARNWTLYLKNETGFKDAWVFSELPDGNDAVTFFDQSGNRHTSPRYAGSSELLPATEGSVALASAAEDASASYQYMEETEALTFNAEWTTNDDLSFTADIKDRMRLPGMHLDEGDIFTFSVEAGDGKSVPAEIMLVDYKKAKKITGFRTGEYVGLKAKQRNRTVTLVCDIFGYSVESRTINLDKLSRARDVKKNEAGVWEVKFRLRPMKVNELSILYNTVFYKDAAVLQPSSKEQLDQVLALMKANPAYKILLHSHCNPSSRRAIRVPSDEHYFDLDASYERKGSDKQLTKERGDAIRSYLVDNGVDGSRVQVFGWGSLDNLVSPTSADPSINDRIEVELLQNQ